MACTPPPSDGSPLQGGVFSYACEDLGYRWVDFLDELGVRYSIYETKDDPSSKNKHTGVIKSNYRRGLKPIVRNRCFLIQYASELYLPLLVKRRNKLDNKFTDSNS